MRRAQLGLLVSVLGGMLALPAAAFAHAERPAFFPDHYAGSVPTFRTSGGNALVVCKPDSKARIAAIKSSTVRKRNQDLLKTCKFARHPGRGERGAQLGPHLRAAGRLQGGAHPQRALSGPEVRRHDRQPGPGHHDRRAPERGNPAQVPTYEYQRTCPNAQNLIAIIGDGPDDDRVCDDKCHIQITGTGETPADVLITGNRAKLNVIRADRADGVYLANFTIEFSDFNNIYALETNGFVFKDIVSRYSREYGFLSFTSDNGIYDHVEAFGSGDSGVYPGSGPEGHCAGYGIEIRNSNSHDNTIGYSGTAGNGIWAHDNRFHDNSTGLTTDSFAAGHPGMPQDSAKWEHNRIYSNNLDLFNDERDAYCKQPIEQRDPKMICPTFQVPGRHRRADRRRQRRHRARQLHLRQLAQRLPAVLGARRPARRQRPDEDLRHVQRQPVHRNHMGVTPAGSRAPNGADGDFWWDEEGTGNCWQDNTGFGGVPITSMPGYPIASIPTALPGCPGSNIFSPGNPARQASQVTCSTWNPADNTDPPGCDWFNRPDRRVMRRAATGAVLACLVVVLAAGCGGGGGLKGAGQLSWEKAPTVVHPPALPADQIVSGMVRNDSFRDLRLKASKVKLLDEAGHQVPGVTVFLNAYLHGLYPPARGPFPRPEAEQVRIGMLARVKPGAKLPFTVAWRLPPGSKPPVKIDYGLGWLPTPDGVGRARVPRGT